MAPAKAVRFEVGEPLTKLKSLHYIPAKIEWNQEANVDTRFTNLINTTEDGALQVELRGRPLYGDKIELPSNFHGFVASKGGPSIGTGKDKGIRRLTAEFSDYTYWNWDRKPSKMDTHVKLQDWLELSQILHTPIEPEEKMEN